MKMRKVAIPLVALGLVLSGCSSSNDLGPAGSGELGATNDINPKDPSELKDGGNLRLALTHYPETFNPLHIDSDGELSSILNPVLPESTSADKSGEPFIDHDYFTDIKLTNTDPQQVTYTINPKAVWSNGRPITWEDLKSQAEALNGTNKDFVVSANSGFDRVAKVERGVDDQQAILTFNKNYGDWSGQYGFLLPKEYTATPDAFNNGLRDGIDITAGPFLISSYDKGQNRVVLSRNPKWWGEKPRLDTITFSSLDISAWLQALQNNELDAISVSSIDDIKSVQNSKDRGIVLRRAPRNFWAQVTFNGGKGSILEDPTVRTAVAKAIDRQAIATAIQTGIVENPKPLNNHVFLHGQPGYQDNSAPVAFDPDAAAKLLDDAGWKLVGDVREKDGRKLEISDVMYQQDSWIQMAQIMQQNLQKIGVKLTIDPVPGQGLFTDHLQPGRFGISQFSWSGSAYPIGSIESIYSYSPDEIRQNMARIGSPELNALIEEVTGELDPAKAIELANEIDKKIFEEVHSIPLFQSAGNVAVRDNLANYGAFGLAQPNFIKAGFIK